MSFGKTRMLNSLHSAIRPSLFDKATSMLDPKIFEDLATRLSAAIAASPAADIEKNARALLSGFFAKLDLVSREEFDIQTQVLLRTREKLKVLEARLDVLERSTENPGSAERGAKPGGRN
jgi:BMFP domain-containing protein YqiC